MNAIFSDLRAGLLTTQNGRWFFFRTNLIGTNVNFQCFLAKYKICYPSNWMCMGTNGLPWEYSKQQQGLFCFSYNGRPDLVIDPHIHRM